MKRLAIAAALAAATALVAPAFAAPPAKAATTMPKEHSSNGVVASYSADTHLLKLKSGTQFKVASSVTAAPKQGDKVTVRWTSQGSERMADSVTISH